jgi:molecular chaperone DnaJ
MTDTFYERLDVDAGADQDEIAAAYREQVKEHHPDVSDAPDATERFTHISEAYDVLSDPVERRRYDRLGHESYRELSGAPTDRSDRGDAHRDTSGGQRRRDADTTSSAGGGPRTGHRTGTQRESQSSQRRTARGQSNRRDGTRRERQRRRQTRGTTRPAGFWAAIAATDVGRRVRNSPVGPLLERLAQADWNRSRRTATAVRRNPAVVAVTRVVRRGRAVVSWIGSGFLDPISRAAGEYDAPLWLGVLRSFGSGRILERENAVLLGGAAMYAYPFLLWSLLPALEALASGVALGPIQLLLFTTLLVGSVLLSGFPNVGLLFFSSWGVVLPIILWRSDQHAVASALGAVVLVVCWLPFLHSVVVLELIRRERGFI